MAPVCCPIPAIITTTTLHLPINTPLLAYPPPHRPSFPLDATLLLFFQQVMDEGTKEALAEQLRLGQTLRRKIEGRAEGSSEEDSEGTDVSSGG